MIRRDLKLETRKQSDKPTKNHFPPSLKIIMLTLLNFTLNRTMRSFPTTAMTLTLTAETEPSIIRTITIPTHLSPKPNTIRTTSIRKSPENLSISTQSPRSLSHPPNNRNTPTNRKISLPYDHIL